MFYVLKMTLENLNVHFFKVEARKLMSNKAIFVHLLWLLCHFRKLN